VHGPGLDLAVKFLRISTVVDKFVGLPQGGMARLEIKAFQM